MRAVWLTDIHLNFLSPVGMEKFFSLVRGSQPDALLISGDIGESSRLEWYLRRIENRLPCPIYFVLGNHDYYGSSFSEVRAIVSRLTTEVARLRWLTAGGIVMLTPDAALIGHDSWADGRCGNYALSEVVLNDYVMIDDFRGLSKAARLEQLNRLGDEAAAFCRQWLPVALSQYTQVYFLTHVPPFREACWHEGQLSDDHFLPHFACKAVGEALVEVMQRYPERQLKVLCGHTHSPGHVDVLPNLQVLTGQAEYGVAQIQEVFEFG